MLNLSFGGMRNFLWNLRLFAADTNHDTVPSLAVKYCVKEDLNFAACDCIHLLTLLVTLGYFLCIYVYLNIEN